MENNMVKNKLEDMQQKIIIILKKLIKMNGKLHMLAVCMLLAFIAIVFIVRSESLTVTCEAGGPYTRTATKMVKGEVTNNSENVKANVTVSIVGTAYSEEDVSNKHGRYHVKFMERLDIGTYTASVTADNNTNSGTCTDTFEVKMFEVSPECLNKNITVAGKAMYAATGALIPEGNVTATLVGDKDITNSTRISNGDFSINLSGCLKPADRFLIKIHIVKDSDENWSYVIMSGV